MKGLRRGAEPRRDPAARVLDRGWRRWLTGTVLFCLLPLAGGGAGALYARHSSTFALFGVSPLERPGKYLLVLLGCTLAYFVLCIPVFLTLRNTRRRAASMHRFLLPMEPTDRAAFSAEILAHSRESFFCGDWGLHMGARHYFPPVAWRLALPWNRIAWAYVDQGGDPGPAVFSSMQAGALVLYDTAGNRYEILPFLLEEEPWRCVERIALHAHGARIGWTAQWAVQAERDFSRFLGHPMD